LTKHNPRIFLSAGEASGDHYGAMIIAELRTRHPRLATFGLGGKEMEEAGLDRVVRAEDVAHMGITEVIRHAPRVYNSYRRLVASIKKRRPDVAILIDFPDVNFRLARELKKLNIPVIYFVSPQLWAWKRSRLRWVQQRVSRMMVIFPFEEHFYRSRGVDAKFVGHPLAELPKPTISRAEYATKAAQLSQDHWFYGGGPGDDRPVEAKGMKLGEIRYELDPKKQWIALLPGSRISEIRNNLQTMVDAAYEIPGDYEFLIPVAQTITDRQLNAILYHMGDLYLGKAHAPKVTFVRDAREALYHARASVVASGTATVQAAVIGNPFVVVYRVSPLTFRLAKRLVRYPPEIWNPVRVNADGNLPIAMVNLIAGRRVVPELLQTRFTAGNVATALKPLLADGPDRDQMIADLAEVRRSLQPPPGASSIEQVCDAVEGLLPETEPGGGPKSAAGV
jgi:lipid-A-disaccharide synthase